MNLFILTCLLCFVVCSTLDTQGSDASAPEAGDAGGPVIPDPADGPPSSPDDDHDVLSVDVEQDGTGEDPVSLDTDLHPKGGKKKKGKGKKKNNPARKIITPSNPEHTLLTSGYTSTLMTAQDPCTSTHQHYCVHGTCKHIDGLQEPTCTCWKDYDGKRCEIHILFSITGQSGGAGLTQTVQIIIGVVLLAISCLAILLMAYAHYRSHKNVLASYLGTATEQEKLQTHTKADVVVV